MRSSVAGLSDPPTLYVLSQDRIVTGSLIGGGKADVFSRNVR